MNDQGDESRQDKLIKIIRGKIIPMLNILTGSMPAGVEEALIRVCRLIPVIKDQYVDTSGPAAEGHLFFLDSGLADTHYRGLNDKNIVTRIWKRHEVILDVNSFINGTDRIENVHVLDIGVLVSIAFSNLRILLDTFPSLYPLILHLQADRERQYLYYQQLLRLSVDERVKIYLDDNPGIAARISNDYIATHLDVSRSKFSIAYAKYRKEKGTTPS